jgi:fusion and transport protein UGO1
MAHPVQLSSSRDTPNPLRPYYRPPSIGLPPADVNATSASAGPSSSLGSSARHVFDDLDYSSFLNDGDSSSVADMGRKVLDQALWKYTSVLLAQPFDVAKTILQVRLATQLDAESTLRRRTSARFAVDQYPPSDDESDPDEPSYFTPTKPIRAAEARSRSRRPRTPPSRDSREQSPAPHVLQLRRPDSVMEALSQLWQQAGAAAMWKATNATFIYNVLLKAVEGWTRNLLSALFDLPDPSSLASVPAEVVAGAMGGLDLADSPSPLASLGIAVAASAIAGLLLAPLDLVRTRYAVLSCPVRSHTDHSQTHSYTNCFTTARHPTKSPPPAESYNPYLPFPNHSPPLYTSDPVEYQYSSRPSSILPC